MRGRPAAPEPLAVSLANVRADRVKRVKALEGRSARSRAGQFLVEGPHAVREAVRFAAADVRDVYVTPDAALRFPEIVTEARDAGLAVHGGTDEVLQAMSGDAQGVLAVANIRDQLLAEAIEGAGLVAILNEVRDPGNAGTAMRTADAAGANAVILAGDSIEPTNPKVVRSSAGSLFHLPVVRGVSLEEAIAAARASGLRVLAADAAGDQVLGGAGADARALSAPTAWVFGNEARGLSAEELALADAAVRIPMRGHAESLNLAASVAVCLFASAAGREPAS